MTEITDEMVERAYGYSPKGCGIQRWQIKDMLIAALNPPPEPEIEVSEGMKFSGCQAYANVAYGGNSSPSEWMLKFVSDIYRAMESTRLKEAKQSNQFGVRLYWDKNDRRQRGQVVMTDRRIGDRRGRDRFIKANT